jgi:hypothetical protein
MAGKRHAKAVSELVQGSLAASLPFLPTSPLYIIPGCVLGREGHPVDYFMSFASFFLLLIDRM